MHDDYPCAHSHHRCQAQCVAQDTKQKHGTHVFFFLFLFVLPSFFFLIFGDPIPSPEEHFTCLYSSLFSASLCACFIHLVAVRAQFMHPRWFTAAFRHFARNKIAPFGSFFVVFFCGFVSCFLWVLWVFSFSVFFFSFFVVFFLFCGFFF